MVHLPNNWYSACSATKHTPPSSTTPNVAIKISKQPRRELSETTNYGTKCSSRKQRGLSQRTSSEGAEGPPECEQHSNFNPSKLQPSTAAPFCNEKFQIPVNQLVYSVSSENVSNSLRRLNKSCQKCVSEDETLNLIKNSSNARLTTKSPAESSTSGIKFAW